MSPSSSPSASPSISPSTSPSASPSISPSASPSESPSTSPSTSPSGTETIEYICIAGWERNELGDLCEAAGNCSVVNDGYFSNYCFKLISGGVAADYAFMHEVLANGRSTFNINNQETAYIKFDFKYDVLPASGDEYICVSVDRNAYAPKLWCALQDDGKILFGIAGPWPAAPVSIGSSGVLTQGQWYRIEMYCDSHATNGSYEFRIDLNKY